MSAEKPKIAYIVSMAKGLEAFIHREIRILKLRGIDILIFAIKNGQDKIYGPQSCDCPVFVPTRWAFPAIIMRTLLGSVMFPDLLKTAIRHGTIVEFGLACYFAPIMKRIDISHIHCHFGDRKLFVGFFCAEILKRPLSVTVHSYEIHKNPNPRMLELALQRCDRVIPISNLARQILIERYKAPEEKTIVTRLGVECTEYASVRHPVTVLTVARFHEVKGYNYLLDAAQILSDENIRFVFIGYGDLDLASMVESRNLQKRVVVFNKMNHEQLKYFYGTANIFCLPSIDLPGRGPEGIPVVLMEAMAAGLPVISTPTGAIPELVQEVLVAPQDPQALADSIRQLALNPEERDRMGKKNQEIVRRLHSERNLDDLENLFRKSHQ